MAFMKYAKATVIQPQVSGRTWGKIRTASHKKNLAVDLVEQASGILGGAFSPDEYLLTHATIVASVDTFEPSNVKLGGSTEDGFRVNRKFGNYRVKSTCDKFINNNLDCWDRDVLMKSYRTFIGAHNFVEHVQVEDLSKGRIIDAVARDIGDSVYVDILVATHRKHADLVKAIENGKMDSMSMGCTVDFTQCTKCGHVAVDETEMCKHVRYEKGNTFFDENGHKHRIAELCGHKSIDPTGGVTFIEASWVATPAFTGAVMRNILHPESLEVEMQRKADEILSQPPKEWSSESTLKAAKNAFDFGGDDGDDDEGGDDESDPIKDLQDDIEQIILNKVKKKIREQLNSEEEAQKRNPSPSPEESSAEPNDNIIKQGAEKTRKISKRQRQYLQDVRTIVAHSVNKADLINSLAEYNNFVGLPIPISIYRTALSIGATTDYSSEEEYLSHCSQFKGSKLTQREKKTLLKLGGIISMRNKSKRR